MPWDMCCEMMTGMKETANTAKFATSELRGLFDEWCQQIEKELLDFVKEKGSIKIPEMVEKFNLSEESIKYLLSRLANKNLIDYKYNRCIKHILAIMSKVKIKPFNVIDQTDLTEITVDQIPVAEIHWRLTGNVLCL